MATELQLCIDGQPNLENGHSRKMSVLVGLPDQGCNADTGMIVLAGGYGSKMMSHVYVKMRNLFADIFNMIVLQCDYFGYQYVNNDFLDDPAVPEESIDAYHEMGPMQAMDHLIAIWAVMDRLEADGRSWDRNKIIFYGHSHGAYLGWLCNAFAPKLFSAIIDNSAYLFPYYIDQDRELERESSEKKGFMYHFYVSDHISDRQIYDLTYLYQRVKNEALILTFHGSEDTMISFQEKQNFVRNVPNTVIHKITPDNLKECFCRIDGVDHPFFNSAKHSLDADFLWFFLYVVQKYHLLKAWGERGLFTEKKFRTAKYWYTIRLLEGKPIMLRDH